MRLYKKSAFGSRTINTSEEKKEMSYHSSNERSRVRQQAS